MSNLVPFYIFLTYKGHLLEKFNFINNVSNRSNPAYLQILKDWNLFSEIRIIQHYQQLSKLSVDNG